MRWVRAAVARAAVAMVATSLAATPRPTATQEAAATKEAPTKPTLTAISATLTTTATVGMAHTTAAIRPNPGLARPTLASHPTATAQSLPESRCRIALRNHKY